MARMWVCGVLSNTAWRTGRTIRAVQGDKEKYPTALWSTPDREAPGRPRGSTTTSRRTRPNDKLVRGIGRDAA